MIADKILITSKDFTNHVCDYYNVHHQSDTISLNQFKQIIEADEFIDENGNIKLQLAEHEINRILRIVFNDKKANIYICLRNSHVNSVHEKTLLNLLQTAGCKHLLVMCKA